MYYVSTNALVSYILDNEAVKLMNLILVSIMKHKDGLFESLRGKAKNGIRI